MAPLKSGLRWRQGNDRCRSDCETAVQRVNWDRQRRQIRCRYSNQQGGDDYPSDSKYSVNVSYRRPRGRIEFNPQGATSGNSRGET